MLTRVVTQIIRTLDSRAQFIHTTAPEFLYVLTLKDGKYYVGKSTDPEARYHSHCTGVGAKFTSIYKPVSIQVLAPVVSPFDEDCLVKKLMQLYGINSVRGGTYTQVNFDETTFEFLQREILHAEGKCLKCGQEGHYASQCTSADSIYDVEGGISTTKGSIYEEDIKISPKRRRSYGGSRTERTGLQCHRCGRIGHKTEHCYAKTDLDENWLAQ